MRWFRKRARSSGEVDYPEVTFHVVGDPLTPVRWHAHGETGPLKWEARMRKGRDGVRWNVTVAGTLTGPDTETGTSANPYAAADACRAALRAIVDDHNRYLRR